MLKITPFAQSAQYQALQKKPDKTMAYKTVSFCAKLPKTPKNNFIPELRDAIKNLYTGLFKTECQDGDILEINFEKGRKLDKKISSTDGKSYIKTTFDDEGFLNTEEVKYPDGRIKFIECTGDYSKETVEFPDKSRYTRFLDENYDIQSSISEHNGIYSIKFFEIDAEENAILSCHKTTYQNCTLEENLKMGQPIEGTFIDQNGHFYKINYTEDGGMNYFLDENGKFIDDLEFFEKWATDLDEKEAKFLKKIQKEFPGEYETIEEESEPVKERLMSSQEILDEFFDKHKRPIAIPLESNKSDFDKLHQN